MNLADMKGAIILLALVALIGSASAIALSDFGDTLTANSAEKNITDNGLEGIGNTTSYLDTIGTIIGVVVLVGIVIMGFRFATK